MGGGGGGSSTIQENALPDYAQPYVIDFLDRSKILYTAGLGAFYTGPTYALQNANEVVGIAAIISRATSGHPINTAAQTLIQNTLDGIKFGFNPKMDALFTARVDMLLRDFTEITLPDLHNEALSIGRFGGGSHNAMISRSAENLAMDITKVAEEIYAGDFSYERERRVLNLGMDIPYGSEDIKDAEFLRQAGLYNREWLQGKYTDAFQKWKDEQIREIKNLEILGNAIRSLVGAQTISTVPFYSPSPFAQVAGIAVAGLGMYGSLYKSGQKASVEKEMSIPSRGSPSDAGSPKQLMDMGNADLGKGNILP